ncbi:MAG: hypothetical protein LAQ30_14895 [Acidobacteriia bacterium]|nr:hypothetical protein [Terriglobia bacterium]
MTDKHQTGKHHASIVACGAKIQDVDVERRRIFLLSPANAGGERAKLLFRPGASFELAARLRNPGVPLGEAFAFISGLYFRGKLEYSKAFAAPPEGIPGAFVITSGYGEACCSAARAPASH